MDTNISYENDSSIFSINPDDGGRMLLYNYGIHFPRRLYIVLTKFSTSCITGNNNETIYLFIYLFTVYLTTVNSSDYIASNGRILKLSRINLRYFPEIWMEELRKITKTIHQCPDRDLKRFPLK
jgi:hypothetical protein